MDPMSLYAAGTAVDVVSGILANIFSRKDRDKAMQAYEDALAEIKAIGAPPDLSREILLEKFEQVGVLTPELEEAIALEAPKVAAIQEAPELRKAQMTALQLIGQRATAGATPEDRARLAEIQLQQARDTEAKRQQILQSYQQRGLGGAGSELAAQLQAASAGSAQSAEQGTQLAAQAQRAALEAAREYGALGGQIRGQEFDIARTKASAEDQAAMARFNEAVGRQQRNVATRMGVQQQNLAARQRASDLNVGASQEEAKRRVSGAAQTYQLALNRAGLRSGALQQMGQAYAGQGQQTAGMVSGVGTGLGQGLIAGGTYLAERDANKPSDQKNPFEIKDGVRFTTDDDKVIV